ncbi:hypothetical protein ACFPM7_04735 [Actinokineospora guangxiensis]|uniref:Uncharacterized protein n=1 Tax=Actinokineospora guangxiensis TaxID=1490288 RepID=A0ABW0EJ68_9PSEU
MVHTPEPVDPRLADGGPDYDEATVAAVGKLTEAWETVQVARGHLYAFHQLTGKADFELEDAVEGLAAAGHTAFAERLRRELLGRNVLPGRWTFQVVEDYDETFYDFFAECEAQGRELTGGHRHLHEAGLKRARRSRGEPGHEAVPADSPP